MGWVMGIEPTTSWTTIRRSNHLSYTHQKVSLSIIAHFLLFSYKLAVPLATPGNRLPSTRRSAT